jgi:signal transduction histidine kinase
MGSVNSVVEATLNAIHRVEDGLDGEVGAEVAQLVVSRLHEYSNGRLMSSLYRMWDDRMWLVAQAGNEVVFDGIGLDFGVVGRAARTGEVQRVARGEVDPDWVSIRSGFSSQLAIPVGDHIVNLEFDEAFDGDTSQVEAFAKRFVRRVRSARSSTVPGGDVARSLVTMVNIDSAELIAEYALRITARYSGMGSARIVVIRPDGPPLTAAWQMPEFHDIPDIDHVVELSKQYRGFSTALVPGDVGPDQLVIPFSDHRGFRGGIVGLAESFDLSADHLAPVAAIAAHTLAVLHRVELEESLLEAHAARSRFIASLSHELRTPLTAVVGYGEMLVEGVEDPEERHEFAVAIRDSAAHLLSLVTDVLDVARSDAGRLVIGGIEEIPLRELTEDVLALMQPEAAASRVRLVDQVDGSLTVAGNVKRVTQILVNLISNAVKYSRDGVIRIEAEQSGPSVIIRVVDEGEGIDPSIMSELFQPFSGRSAETGRPGTGLGLVISRRLAEAMEGSLHLESAGLGQGTTAVLSLPSTIPLNVDEGSR